MRRQIRVRYLLCRCSSDVPMLPILTLLWLLLCSQLLVPSSSSSSSSSAQQHLQQQQHSSNYAVILSSSRYWFNYRHAANALTFYQFLKRQGCFDDDHIILMLADEYAVNPRNPFKNRIFTQGKNGGEELYDEFTEIDYRGDDVTVENLAHVLLGTTTTTTTTTGTGTTRQQQQLLLPILNSDANSNIILFWTGHGGDKFFKFQDVEEILAQHLANIFRQMHVMGKYRHVLFIADTCQAFTLFDRIHAERIPNITTIGSSLRDESSYAHHSDPDLGLTVIERYSYALKQFLQSKTTTTTIQTQLHQTTLQQGLVDPYTYTQQRAHVGIGEAGAVRKASEIPLSDFFVNVEKDKKKMMKKNHRRDKPRLIPTSTASFKERSIRQMISSQKFDAPQSANSRSQSSKKQKDRQKPTSNNLAGKPYVEPTDGLFWICLAALMVAVFGASYVVDRHSIIMDKMQRYNALFDGRCKSMHDNDNDWNDGNDNAGATIRATIEDLWDKSSLIIHTPNGEELNFDTFLEIMESYLQRGMLAELLLLEKHPKGLRYRARVLLDNQVMTLESIATVINDKIVEVEPVAANSDMAKFLGKSSTS